MEAEIEARTYCPILESHGEAAHHNFPRLTGVTTRTIQPSDYIFKIQGFSNFWLVLQDEIINKYTSSTFEAGGYKWKLHLYPAGDTERSINAEGYISLYLGIVETDKLPLGWEVNVELKLFVYNQIQDKYYCVQDGEGKLSRFNHMTTQNGFPRLISRAIFNNASNGYLVDDTCSFGAEVFVIRNHTRKVESLSALRLRPNCISYTLKLPDFSKINVGCYKSSVFSAANRNWAIEVCNREAPAPHGLKYLELFLHLIDTETYFFNLNFLKWFRKHNDDTFPLDFCIYCKFQVRDQVNGSHVEENVSSWFRVKSNQTCCHLTKFLALDDLKDPSKGLLLNDTLIIDLTFERIREVKIISS